MHKHSIAFVTSTEQPLMSNDDALTASMLSDLGYETKAMPWDDNSIDWKKFDAVVLRSCWNYHRKPQAFSNWLSVLDEQQVRVLNSAQVVRSNMHKAYLLALQQRGVLIPKTSLLQKESNIEWNKVLAQLALSKAVVKPAISADAHNTYVISPSTTQYLSECSALLLQTDVLLQEFLEEIKTEGEWSLIFFDKQFSHALLKKPAEKDFRVQQLYGGEVVSADPPANVRLQAEHILSLIEAPLVYARVDGVCRNNRFVLMELELIEPSLYLAHSAQAAGLFAHAIIKAIRLQP